MKKSTSVQLFFVNSIVLGVSGCDSEPPPVDPCNTPEPSTLLLLLAGLPLVAGVAVRRRLRAARFEG